MDESPQLIPPAAAPTSNRRFIATLVIMAIAFATIVLFRNRIRCEWWGRQLAAATTPTDQAYYISCLSAVGDDALPAISRLSRDPRPEIRSIALLLIAQRPIATVVEIIPPLLHDADRDIRESAGTTLAFSGAPAAIALLCDTAVSPSQEIACSALASLGRTSDAAAIATLCDALTRRPHSVVRAQAAESLAEAITPSAERTFAALATTKSCDPVAALVHALADAETFHATLATENQILRVTAHMATRTTQPVSQPAPRPAVRTVADIAAAGLSRLTGETIEARPAENEAEWTARIRTQIEARHR